MLFRSFNVTGFITGFNDIYTTGATYDNNTKLATFRRNDGNNYTLNLSSIIDTYVTGGTYSNGSITFNNNQGGTFTVSGLFTGQTFFDTFTTGFTYNNNTFTIRDNSGQSYNATINNVTGLTVNGTLQANTISATTYQNLPVDIRVTGATYNNNNFTFTNNTGGTFSVGFNTVTGLTVNGTLQATTISATTYQNLPVVFYYQNTTPTGTGTSQIVLGSTWEHSDTGNQYVYIYDGDTYQWIQQTLPQGTGPIGPTGPNNISTGTTTSINAILKGNGINVLAAVPNVDYQSALGYTAENVTNKSNSLDTSTTKYPTNNAVQTALDNFSDDVDYAIMINQRIIFNF